MGSSESSEVKTEQKFVDANGQVNNNIIIQEAKDTHAQMLLNGKLLYATYFLILIELLKLSLYSFCAYKKSLKRKYQKEKKSENA